MLTAETSHEFCRWAIGGLTAAVVGLAVYVKVLFGKLLAEKDNRRADLEKILAAHVHEESHAGEE